MTDLNHIRVTNDFFREKPMPTEKLKTLQANYKKEVEEAAKNGGCSKCKMISIRRRFKKFILNHLNSNEEK